jgi:hypothetical protein
LRSLTYHNEYDLVLNSILTNYFQYDKEYYSSIQVNQYRCVFGLKSSGTYAIFENTNEIKAVDIYMEKYVNIVIMRISYLQILISLC